MRKILNVIKLRLLYVHAYITINVSLFAFLFSNCELKTCF